MGDQLKWQDVPVWLRRVWAVTLTNFALFIVITLAIGGDGLNGREESGRYFVAEHGRYTEVSKAVYYYSCVHAASAMVLIFFALFALFWVTRSSVRMKKKNA